MTPLPEEGEVSRYLKLFGDGWGQCYNFVPFLRAQMDGLITHHQRDVYPDVYGLYSRESFDLPTAASLHLPSVIFQGLEMRSLSLSDLPPKTQAAVDMKDNQEILECLGLSMTTRDHRVSLTHAASGEEMHISSRYRDSIDIETSYIVGALMLLQPHDWPMVKKTGLVLLNVGGVWPNRVTKLGEIGLMGDDGKLRALSFDERVAYQRDRQWEHLGPPVVVFQG